MHQADKHTNINESFHGARKIDHDVSVIKIMANGL